MERLRHYAENMQGGAGQGAGAADDDEDDEEDEDVPSLVENFEVIQCTVALALEARRRKREEEEELNAVYT